MQLQPRRPPGRIDRKAAAYASDIGELRAAGDTYEAIREALADVGIALSTSSLRREVRRLCSQRRAVPPRAAVVSLAPASAAALPQSQAPPPRSPVRRDGPAGRDLAEAFFNANPSNQLLKTQETS